MNCWNFFNLHFIPLFVFLCIFSALLLLLIYLILTRAKIGIDKNGKWFYNYSPFSREKQNMFLNKIMEDYKMDAFKKSYFLESKNRQIGLCNLAIQELEAYFNINDLSIEENKNKYNTDIEFKKEYDKKKADLKSWKIELNEVKSKEWHGNFCGDFENIINGLK